MPECWGIVSAGRGGARLKLNAVAAARWKGFLPSKRDSLSERGEARRSPLGQRFGFVQAWDGTGLGGHWDWDVGLGRDTGTGTGHEVATVGRVTFFLSEDDPQKQLTHPPRQSCATRSRWAGRSKKGAKVGTNGGSPIQVCVCFANWKVDPV